MTKVTRSFVVIDVSKAWLDVHILPEGGAYRLRSMKGVGPIAAATPIAELPELGTLSRRQAAALTGVAPLNRDSGQVRGRRCVWGGRADLRKALYMAAIVAMRFNPAMATFYNRLTASGKRHKIAITAVIRKMVVTLNALIRDKRDFQGTA